MASEAVTAALVALRQAMIDDGEDEGTVDAKLFAAVPNEVTLAGNIADLMRGGAAPLASEGVEVDLSSMTKAELQAEADSRGVEYASSDTKADLIAALGG
jgi:hypothetical protein